MTEQYRYFQMTDMGLQERVGEMVEAQTSDGVSVSAILENQWNGWNFTHIGCGFRIFISDEKSRSTALSRFKTFVSGKSSTAFKQGEAKARAQPDFRQPPAPTKRCEQAAISEDTPND